MRSFHLFRSFSCSSKQNLVDALLSRSLVLLSQTLFTHANDAIVILKQNRVLRREWRKVNGLTYEEIQENGPECTDTNEYARVYLLYPL